MIVIAGSIAVRADRREQAVAAALEMARATQAEDGCRGYRFSADLADANRFFIFEEWESPEALALHFQTPHMHTFRSRIPDLVAGPATITRYEVSSAGPLG